MIPKVLHFVWIGDESKRPDNCIQTWKDLNPDYEIKIWGNKELKENKWYNARHMMAMAKQELCGVADMMRYEILYEHGGITVDADSICLAPLEDWLLKPDAFSHWENELVRPNLIQVSFMGSVPKNVFFGHLIETLKHKETVVDSMAWESVGTKFISEMYRETGYPLTIYPSHYFSKDHFTGHSYEGNDHCFATQLWGSTKNTYDEIWKIK